MAVAEFTRGPNGEPGPIRITRDDGSFIYVYGDDPLAAAILPASEAPGQSRGASLGQAGAGGGGAASALKVEDLFALAQLAALCNPQPGTFPTGNGGRGPTGPTGATGATGAAAVIGGEALTVLQATATADDTTASLTDVVAAGMTLTPAAGTYLVWFTSSFKNSGPNTDFASIYSGGAKALPSEERASPDVPGSVLGDKPFTSMALVTVDGTQAIEGRWRVSGGLGTIHQRTLTLLKQSYP